MLGFNDADDDRGQVGIGTLIVFIALVLVAAVAAGVLVNTAGLLQSRAEDTGSDAQAQVSNQIDVVSATGVVDTANADVDTVELVVKKSSGSDALDLSRSTIEYTSDSSAATLTYNATKASATQFTTAAVQSGNSDTVLSSTGQRIKITVDTKAIEGGGLAEGSEATLRIVDQSGASTVYGINIPDTLGQDNYVLV